MSCIVKVEAFAHENRAEVEDPEPSAGDFLKACKAAHRPQELSSILLSLSGGLL